MCASTIDRVLFNQTLYNALIDPCVSPLVWPEELLHGGVDLARFPLDSRGMHQKRTVEHDQPIIQETHLEHLRIGIEINNSPIRKAKSTNLRLNDTFSGMLV